MAFRRLLGFALLILIGLALPLGALEAALRFGLFSAKERVTDRPSRYFLPLHSGNERDYPHQEAKAPGTFRIVIVGDSFTFGDYLQFDDTYSKRLERWLNLNDGPQKVEVINYSKPGFSTFDEILLVRTAASTLSPDLILLQFTLNDPEIRPYRDSHRDELNNSILNSPFVKRWKGLEFALTRYKAWKSRGDFRRYYFDLFENNETWNRCAESLDTIRNLAAERSVPLGVVIFPLFDYPMTESSYPFLPLHRKVQEKLSQLNVPWLDLFDSYLGMMPDRLAVIPGTNSHPNEIANRIAAEKIYGWLFKQRFIGKEQYAIKVSRFRNIYNPRRINDGKVAPEEEEPPKPQDAEPASGTP